MDDLSSWVHHVRKCADMVQIGECITFPNRLVVDKRPLPVSLPSVWIPQTEPPAQPVNPYIFPPGQTWSSTNGLTNGIGEATDG